MQNAKQEFLDHINHRCVGGRTVKCAEIKLWNNNDYLTAVLPVGYTHEDSGNFLRELNVEYDDGFGCQYLFGTIWYDDGLTWSQRGEYGNSEWWEFMQIPEIDSALKGKE